MNRTWTESEIELLKQEYPKNWGRDICRFFPNKTAASIKTKANKIGLKKEKEYLYLTAEQKEYLKKNYSNTDNKILAEHLNCTVEQVYNNAYSLGLKKVDDWQSNLLKKYWRENPDNPSKKGFFRKGQVPSNKGKKMSPEIYEKVKGTMFKKGQNPHNAKPVGYECVQKKVTGEQYIYIKVEGKRKLTLKHRYLWEQAHGKIPKGYNIQFKDGNTLNCELENLYIISREEQMKQNSIMNYSPQMITLLHTVGKFKRIINKQIYNENESKHIKPE